METQAPMPSSLLVASPRCSSRRFPMAKRTIPINRTKRSPTPATTSPILNGTRVMGNATATTQAFSTAWFMLLAQVIPVPGPVSPRTHTSKVDKITPLAEALGPERQSQRYGRVLQVDRQSLRCLANPEQRPARRITNGTVLRY